MCRERSNITLSHSCHFLFRKPRVKVEFFLSRRNSTVITVSPSSSPLTLSFEVCSNPRPDRVVFATPVFALRPGEERRRGMDEGVAMRARPLRRSRGNVTCHRAELDLPMGWGRLRMILAEKKIRYKNGWFFFSKSAAILSWVKNDSNEEDQKKKKCMCIFFAW